MKARQSIQSAAALAAPLIPPSRLLGGDAPRRKITLGCMGAAVALLSAPLTARAAADQKADDPSVIEVDDTSDSDGSSGAAGVSDDFKSILRAEGYRFNEKVKTAYIADQKRQAVAELGKLGKSIPNGFMDWVDSDPVLRATIYGSPHPTHVLLMFYSLSLDVGEGRYQRYRNWLLAAAVKNSAKGPAADVSPRPPLKLIIPGDPRRPVNTRDPNRPPDPNDHIINFLEDNRIVASDVMYESAWQSKFNEFMAAKGLAARVDCSMKLGPGTPAAKRAALKKVMDAYRLFETAYEEKGRIPKQRDPRIGLAGWVVLQIDNHSAGRSKSKFPLDRAPWPVLTALLNPRLSLREAYHLNNSPNPIPPDRRKLNAFNTEMLKAVDVRPFPYAEGSWFMIKKHAGACGTRAMLAANQNKAYGLPSAPVGEIGHASWVEFQYFAKGDRYAMRFKGGAQNPAVMSIHLALPISRGREQERGTNWAAFLSAIQSHGGVPAYMESMLGYHVLQALSAEEMAKYGANLKADVLAIHPGNVLLAGVLDRNTAEAVGARKEARKRKNNAGTLLKQQRRK